MSQSYQNTSDIYPSLVYDDAPAAIEWLNRAFGFKTQFVVPGPDSRVEHSELSMGNGVIMVSSPKPEMNWLSPRNLSSVAQALSVYVDDPDAHHDIAVAAGARITRPLQTEEYGARGYMVTDPEGHVWYFGNYRPGAYWSQASGTENQA
ncbi:VOC family protein [Undibacterium sp. TJN19]|uniref:VOC family protein n=1 Tax=Undibacterium sp. TJN19 TaxID=3413055 RepID=UPI003BF19840